MLLARSRRLIKTLNPLNGFNKCKSISTSPILYREAQLVEEAPPHPSQSTAVPLPPNPASGSPYYNQNWRNPYPQPPPPAQSSTLIPLALRNQTSQMQAFSRTLDVNGLMDIFADWMPSQRWVDMKQLCEFWVRSLDKDGKPNKPDVHLYNHYLRANLMCGASPAELLDLVSQMDDFSIVPNTASFNLVLKAMSIAGEADAAMKLLDRMLQTGNESLPDDESYDLVLGMLIPRNQMENVLKFLDVALKSGYTMSMKVFNDVIVNCLHKGRLDSLVSVIEKCKKMEQNKALCPSWSLCNDIADFALQSDHSELAFYCLQFLARWIARGEIERPAILRPVDQGLIVSALAAAGRTYNPKLLEASWSILKRTLHEDTVPSSECYLAKITAYSSLGNLRKAYGTLREFEAAYGNSNDEALEHFFSPFTSLNPLVVASSKKGFVTLDEVYYQLENLSQADLPYKSVAALNCIILGCANIWDVDRAYQTFNAIDASFGLTPDIHSYNSLIYAFGKLNKIEEAIKVFDHFVGLGLKPNATTYSLLVDAHLVNKDPKAAFSVIQEMVQGGFDPLKELFKKVRRRCVRKMDYDTNGKIGTLAQQFNIKLGPENRRNMLFSLDYSTESA